MTVSEPVALEIVGALSGLIRTARCVLPPAARAARSDRASPSPSSSACTTSRADPATSRARSASRRPPCHGRSPPSSPWATSSASPTRPTRGRCSCRSRRRRPVPRRAGSRARASRRRRPRRVGRRQGARGPPGPDRARHRPQPHRLGHAHGRHTRTEPLDHRVRRQRRRRHHLEPEPEPEGVRMTVTTERPTRPACRLAYRLDRRHHGPRGAQQSHGAAQAPQGPPPRGCRRPRRQRSRRDEPRRDPARHDRPARGAVHRDALVDHRRDRAAHDHRRPPGHAEPVHLDHHGLAPRDDGDHSHLGQARRPVQQEGARPERDGRVRGRFGRRGYGPRRPVPHRLPRRPGHRHGRPDRPRRGHHGRDRRPPRTRSATRATWAR